MGRHVNDEAGDDIESDAAPHEHARHVAETEQEPSGHLLEPQAVISPDTHVGVELDDPVEAQNAAPSPAHPDALIEHGLVGDGHEME